MSGVVYDLPPTPRGDTPPGITTLYSPAKNNSLKKIKRGIPSDLLVCRLCLCSLQVDHSASPPLYLVCMLHEYSHYPNNPVIPTVSGFVTIPKIRIMGIVGVLPCIIGCIFYSNKM